MVELKNILILTIILLKINKVLNDNFLIILQDGGYTGLFCLAEKYVEHDIFKCMDKHSNCSGIGKDQFNDTSLQLNMDYYNGRLHSCNINECYFNKTSIDIKGDSLITYYLLYESIELLNMTELVKNGETFTAYIDNLNLIDPSNFTIKFENVEFNYTNVSINKNKINCTLLINDDKVYNRNFFTKVLLIYGNNQKTCKKNIYLGFLILYKPGPFDFEVYIKEIIAEYDRKYNKMSKEYEEEIARLKNLIHEHEQKPNYLVLVIFFFIMIFILMILIIAILYKSKLIPCKKKEGDRNSVYSHENDKNEE